jgi:hypothetical protein
MRRGYLCGKTLFITASYQILTATGPSMSKVSYLCVFCGDGGYYGMNRANRMHGIAVPGLGALMELCVPTQLVSHTFEQRKE